MQRANLVGVKKLAALLDVPPSWIYQQTRLGPKTIPFIRIGKYLRFDLDEVINFCREKGALPRKAPRDENKKAEVTSKPNSEKMEGD